MGSKISGSKTSAKKISGVGPDGRLYVAEVGTRSVLAIDPKDGAKTVVADELAIGLAAAKGTPPSYVTTGVAVGKSGAVYVSSDIRNAIYKLIPSSSRRTYCSATAQAVSVSAIEINMYEAVAAILP